MNYRNKLILLTVSLSILFSLKSVAQINILVKNSLEKIKDGNTYVIVGDLDFQQSEKFLEAFKKYWTITKGVKFIKYSDLKGLLKEGDSCFSLETITESSGSAAISFYCFNLWVPSERALKRNQDFDFRDEKSIAWIQVCIHSEPGKKTALSSFDLDGNGYINNWNPALLKNYLLQLSMILQTGKKFSDDDITNKDQLKLLKGATLYCPYDDFDTITGTDGKYDSTIIADLFRHYKFNYKVVANHELESKVSADVEPIYYLLYVHGTERGKMVIVVNSRTGEAIYSRIERSFTHKIKSDQINELSRSIDRS